MKLISRSLVLPVEPCVAAGPDGEVGLCCEGRIGCVGLEATESRDHLEGSCEVSSSVQSRPDENGMVENPYVSLALDVAGVSTVGEPTVETILVDKGDELDVVAAAAVTGVAKVRN